MKVVDQSLNTLKFHMHFTYLKIVNPYVLHYDGDTWESLMSN